MNTMTLYTCYETNVITEDQYNRVESGFCIVEKYDYTYQKELPRFNKIAGVKPYGLPYGDKPVKRYLGIGNQSSTEPPGYSWDIDAILPNSEKEAVEIRDVFYSSAHCNVVWVRIQGSAATVPEGYQFYGCDVTYTPNIEGAYSIINDCMFICKWHGCDEEGTEFLDYFGQLNENGLFDKADTALGYMKHYLSFDWSERGEYCICEVFRKNRF